MSGAVTADVAGISTDAIAKYGQARWNFPLDLPSGPNGTNPGLQMEYVLGQNPGEIGKNLIFNLPEIRLLVGSWTHSSLGRLIAVGTDLFKPETAAEEARTVRTADDEWNVRYRDGSRQIFRRHISDLFLLAESVSPDGYSTVYQFRADGMPKSIEWSIYRLEFEYEERPDSVADTRAGALQVLSDRCRGLSVCGTPPGEKASVPVRGYSFEYRTIAGQSVMTAISRVSASCEQKMVELFWRGDGLDEPPTLAKPDVSPPESSRSIQWKGIGRTDLWTEFGGDVLVYPSVGGSQFGLPETVNAPPSALIQHADHVGFGDIHGRGYRDLIVLSETMRGVHRYDSVTGFGGFEDWSATAPAEVINEGSHLMDLDGNGVADLLVTDSPNDEFRAYLTVDGVFGAERHHRAMGTHWVDLSANDYVTNLSNTQWVDLVRVRNDYLEVAHGVGLLEWSPWQKIAIDLPDGLVDLTEGAVYFSDLTGNGTMDLVVVHSGAVSVYFGSGGLSFVTAFTLIDLRFTPTSNIVIDDFNGLGYSQIMIWSDEGDAFILDPWKGAPPGELLGLDNQLGLLTSYEYGVTTEMAADWAVSWPSPRRVLRRRVIEDQNDGALWDQAFHYHDPVRMRLPISRFFFSATMIREAGSAEVKARRIRFSWKAPEDSSTVYPLVEAAAFGHLETYGIARDEDAFDDNILLQGGYEWTVSDYGETVQTRLGTHWRQLHLDNGDVAHRMTVENQAFDGWGNIKQSRTAFSAKGESRAIVTFQDYAQSKGDVFLDRVMTVRQTNESGVEINKNRYYYDGEPFGHVGAAGLISKVESKVLTDEMSTEWLPCRSAEELGYFRIDEEEGYWRTSKEVEIDGSLRNVRDPFGRTSTYQFDTANIQLIRATDAGNHSIDFEVSYEHARPSSVTESSARQRRQVHDDFGRTVEQFSSPYLLPVATYAYEGPNVLQTRYGQDKLRRDAYQLEIYHNGVGDVFKTLRSDEQGNDGYAEEHVIRGPRGKIVREYAPYRDQATAAFSTREYDELDRVIGFATQNGVRRRHTHDGLTERIEVQSALGDWIHHASKSLDVFFATRKTVSGTKTVGNLVERDNDYRGNPLTLKEPSGRIRRATYDLLGRRWFEESPDRGTQIFIQDAGDQLREVIRNTQTAITYAYSATGQVLESTIADTNETAHRTLGKPGRLGADKLERVDHEAGTNIITYNAEDRPGVRRFETPKLNGAIEVEYRYRPDGQIKEIVYIDTQARMRRVIPYRYDRQGRLAGVPGILKKIEYDDAGAMRRMHYQNGVITELDWQPDKTTMAGFRVSLKDDELHSEDFGFDFRGKIDEIAYHNAMKRSFVRDDLSRVIHEVCRRSGEPPQEFTFDFDPHGNIVELEGRTQIYDAAGRLSAVGSDQVTQDDLGRVTQIGNRQYTYDLTNQCTSVTDPDSTETFHYDHTGNATLSLDGNGDLNWFTPDPTVIATRDGVFGCVVLGELPVAVFRISDGMAKFLHPNHRGDIVLVTDAVGDVVRRQSYSLFGGNPIATAEKGFEGKRWSDAGQCYHFGSRLYAPGLGRFLTPDPMVRDPDRPISYNAYAYSANDPLSYRDETGLGWDPLGDFFDWVGDNIVEIVAVAVIIALIVVTGGAAAVLIGMAIGGVVGGVAAAQSGQNVLRGVLVGAALGGLGAVAGTALASAAGVSGSTTFWGMVANGAIVGSVNGTAMGLASGIAAGESGDVVLQKALAGAVIGGVTGGAFGALEYGVNAYLKAGPSQSFGQFKDKLITPNNSATMSNPSFEKAAMKGAGFMAEQWAKTPAAHTIARSAARVVFSAGGYVAITQTVSGIGVQDLDATIKSAKDFVDGKNFPIIDESF